MRNYRKHFYVFFLINFILSMVYPDENARIKFIKGNISDKTAAVREASEQEAAELSNDAIDFALKYKNELGDDRDLDGLAIAGVLALPSAPTADSETKKILTAKLSTLFESFDSDTVKIAVLNKIIAIKDSLLIDSFTAKLNNFLLNSQNSNTENGTIKAVITTLSYIGDSQSFTILYTCKLQKKWTIYENEINNTMAMLADKSLPQILGIIQSGDIGTIRDLFDLMIKNEQISPSLKAEISENVLSQTISIAEKEQVVNRETVQLQLNAMRIISQSKWTRASAVIVRLFNLAKREYLAGQITSDEFIEVINCTANIAPIDGAALLASYLNDLNKQKEDGKDVSDAVVLSVINALGAIGDKSAFDSILYVTYVNYPDAIIAAARDALARLKW